MLSIRGHVDASVTQAGCSVAFSPHTVGIGAGANVSSHRASSTALPKSKPCGALTRGPSLAPSCGAVQRDLLHLAELGQQPFHAVFELGETCQRLGGL